MRTPDHPASADQRLKDLKFLIERQAAVNRALRLGRVPLLGAKIIRALDETGMLGAGLRVLGTNAIYAYAAVAGVHIDPGLTTTEDIDLLLDSRCELTFVTTEEISQQSLLHILQKVDRSFEKSRQPCRAINRHGYFVDLIKPIPTPPWKSEPDKIGSDPDDLLAAEIEGLAWHESASSFEAVALDEKGAPLRIMTTDPRVWAAHKLWLSKRPDREPIKRQRDAAQSRTVAHLVTAYMPHLPYAWEQLRMLSKTVFAEAAGLFAARDPEQTARPIPPPT